MDEVGEVRIPALRDRLIYSLKRLSDHEYQRRAWSRKVQHSGEAFGTLGFDIDFFYDATDLNEGTDVWIGDMLMNDAEARAIDNVVKAIDQFFDKYPEDRPDEECIELNEWRDVMNAAKKAYELVMESEPAPAGSEKT